MKTGPSAGSVRESEIGFKHIIQAISRLFSSTQHMEGAPVNLLAENMAGMTPLWNF